MLKGYVLAAASAMLCVGGCVTNSASKGCCCPDHSQCACKSCNATGGEKLTSPAATSGATAGDTQIFPIAASEMVKQLQAALEKQGLSITSAQNGVIQTDWKAYDGEMHIARRWQERSRFRVSVIPDVNNPTGASRFEITEQTQRRSNEKANWEEGARRTQRAQELARQIALTIAK